MRGVLLTGVVGGLLVVGGALPAAAEPPTRLEGQVTDSAGVLDDAVAAERVEQLRIETGLQLFVVYVNSFDGAGGDAWADETAQVMQFGSEQLLLAVALF